MPSIYLMHADVARVPEMLAVARYDSRFYDIEPDFTFREAQRLIAHCHHKVRVRPNSSFSTRTYELWFGICFPKESEQIVRKAVHFDDDTLLVHGSSKDDPWCKVVFHPLRENASILRIAALTSAQAAMPRQ